MNALAVVAARRTPPLVQVVAYVRGRGLDNLPDTYRLASLPYTKKIGVGDRLLMVVLDRDDDSILSKHLVTLKTIRLRGSAITEFRGECSSFPLNLVYIHVPTRHARVSKFAVWDLLRGRQTLTDPIPSWNGFAVNIVHLPQPMQVDYEGHPLTIEVVVNIQSSLSDY